MVPFRLTQNLVDAFGVSGYEGAFRRACEVTLQVYAGPDIAPLLRLQASWDSSGIFLLGSTDGV
jgi:hypothetical protein